MEGPPLWVTTEKMCNEILGAKIANLEIHIYKAIDASNLYTFLVLSGQLNEL